VPAPFREGRGDGRRAVRHAGGMDPADGASAAFSPPFADHLRHPRNAGTLAPASVTHRGACDDPACGDRLTLDLHVEDGVVRESRFRVEGCVGAIACGSALTTLLAGRAALPDAVTAGEIEAALGGVPSAKRHALRLAIATWRAALAGPVHRT
ncbi:MAG TPA: iron-sulfur cluster assembly scaffold protein, partial [Planctomycetota bacterium]|nr:iron-sulfur cluster assembly scaffold protein [Planctomycetota bacterium]